MPDRMTGAYIKDIVAIQESPEFLKMAEPWSPDVIFSTPANKAKIKNLVYVFVSLPTVWGTWTILLRHMEEKAGILTCLCERTLR